MNFKNIDSGVQGTSRPLIPKSGKFLLVESGLWKTAQGIRIPPTIGIRNPRVTKVRIPIPGIPSTVETVQNSVLDSFP